MIPLYNTTQVRTADDFAVSELGIPGIILMENAAKSIYDAILNDFKSEIVDKTIGIVCGKGNNGGDGFALARNFAINDYSVIVISLGNEKDLKGDALFNFNILTNFSKICDNLSVINYKNIKSLEVLSGCEIIVDALLGTGTKGALQEPYHAIIDYLNSLDAIKVAVDIPSGLNLETATGDTIFEADLTISLGELKTGLFYGSGYSHAGRVESGSIGIGKNYFEKLNVENYLIEPEDVLDYLPSKDIAAHKYSAGKVFVIAGSGQYAGAAFLTADAVMKSGAGASTLAFPKSIKNIALQRMQVPTVLAYEDQSDEFLSMKSLADIEEKIEWADCVAIGPGLGRAKETFAAVQKILTKYKNKPFIIDADAIYALGNQMYKKINLANKVLTPHLKEFADLLDIGLSELQSNLMEYGKNFATGNDCILVLKGAPTIIFTPAGEALINTTGNPGMAKFGTGDVLTGFIAGMAAQSDSVEEAVIAAVYLHSLSADLLLHENTVYGITSSDILENLPYAIKFICDTFTRVS